MVPLSDHIPSTSIMASNKEVKGVLDTSNLSQKTKRKCVTYAVYTNEKTKMGKRAGCHQYHNVL